MSAHESFRALQRANPRTEPGFDRSVDAVRERIGARPRDAASGRRHAFAVPAIGVALVAAAVAVALLTIRTPGGGPGVESAAAAIRRAATLTAASAQRSGTASVRITHDGRLWAAKTVSWNGDDLSL